MNKQNLFMKQCLTIVLALLLVAGCNSNNPNNPQQNSRDSAGAQYNDSSNIAPNNSNASSNSTMKDSSTDTGLNRGSGRGNFDRGNGSSGSVQ